ncbi:MAG: amidohydrolase family protein [Acidimicrobiia bacterium]
MKIWSNSGDSHYNEPPDLYETLAPSLRERMPRSVKSEDGSYETIYVDGTSFQRPMPRIGVVKGTKGRTLAEALQAPGADDFTVRRADLDSEGIWAEVIYASVGFWNSMITDPVLIREATKAVNDWSASVQRESIRHVMPAQVSSLDIADAVAEVERAAGLGLKALGLPAGTPKGVPDFNRPDWDPLWDVAEEAGMVLACHTGPPVGDDPIHHHGPGAGTMNYLHACYGGIDMAASFAASGILDKRPGLRLLISEAGASWLPFIGDRLDEAFRQHSEFVRDQLSRPPSEILRSQVYASFQHDPTAVLTVTAMGYPNVLWGSDYPHIEGTFGHTQKTLHELFDEQPDPVRHRITQGAFLELFPHVGAPPLEGIE